MFKNLETGRQAVLVGGVRTPFVKAFTHFIQLDAIDLGVAAVGALLKRTSVPWRALDQIIWGNVIIPSASPNTAREIALDLHLPPQVQGHTCIQACVSGLQAITSAAATIERGDADVIIAGGSDSTSNAEIKLPQKIVHALAPLALGKRAKPADLLGVLAQLVPLRELLPKKPEIAERTTGLTMGQSAEQMARRNQVTREAQDAFALQSHHRAAAAIESGRFESEVVPVDTPTGQVARDTLVRGDTSLEKLARLRPVFAADGTLTAGNSSPLTDGAGAVLLMSRAKADSLGYTDLVRVTDWTYVGVDPADQLLLGPALAIPKLLDKTGLGLPDVDLVDIHEAFAAQVLCVLRMLSSEAFAREHLDRQEAVGDVDLDRLNVHGGSVSIGHPFGATGARMVTTMANELRLRGEQRALIGICAAGGIGGAALLERI